MMATGTTSDAEQDDALRRIILFVDDDGNQRDMYKRRLERHGYTVHLAASADAALQALSERRPDVVVLDIAMPERDGLSALQEFLDIDPTLPVIIRLSCIRRQLHCLGG